MRIREHEMVVLTGDIAVNGLEAGDVGTVVHVYANGAACEVEFVALDPVRKHEIAHARALAAARIAEEQNLLTPSQQLLTLVFGATDERPVACREPDQKLQKR